VVKTFKAVLMWTFTVDPTLFRSPREGYLHVQEKRCIGEWVRSMWKRGLLHSDRYFCVLEWQENEWPHWHVLLDADFISIEVAQARWDCFRPDTAGPVKAGRPGFGFVFVSKRDFESREHAANYACKYILKHPENGFPGWVLDSRGEVKRYWPSKGFYDCLPKDEAIPQLPAIEPDDMPCCEEEATEVRQPEKMMTTIRERIARCGLGVALFKVVSVKDASGVHLERQFVERFPSVDLEKVCEVLGERYEPELRVIHVGRRALKKLYDALDWKTHGMAASKETNDG
jgi:hypothetical protein